MIEHSFSPALLIPRNGATFFHSQLSSTSISPHINYLPASYFSLDPHPVLNPSQHEDLTQASRCQPSQRRQIHRTSNRRRQSPLRPKRPYPRLHRPHLLRPP